MSLLKNRTQWLVVWLLAMVYCFVESQDKGDFYIYLSAASDLSGHENIFEKKYVDGYHYYYSVLFALVLNPLAHLPFQAVKFVWLLLNTGLFIHLFQLLSGSKAVKRLDQRWRLIFLGGTFLFSLRFFLGNIGHSQITILILWCCIYGLCNITSGKTLKGSLILALGINIKLLPLVLLPYLLYRGYFKAFGLTVVFYAISLVSPSLIIGHEYNQQLLATWLGLINPANQVHVLDVEERSFHGLSTLLSTLLVENVPDVYALPIKRNIADVSLDALAQILLAVRLLLVAFTLYFLRSRPFRKAGSEQGIFIEVSYILLLIPLIFPHQQYYAFLFAVPAFSVVLYYVLTHYNQLAGLSRVLFISCLAVIYLCANLALLLGTFNAYYDHFKILTWGSLLLIPLLACVSLKNTKSVSAAGLAQ